MQLYKFIDLFSGCGGLSLGLSLAGLEGVFAIERDPMAFDTFKANFLSERAKPINNFSWPSWLEQRAHLIDEFYAEYKDKLNQLQGQIHVIAGGPPCQGFSSAGRRRADDPRNLLFMEYVKVVKELRPSIVVLENVPGMRVIYNSKTNQQIEDKAKSTSFYTQLEESLDSVGYNVKAKIIDSSYYGVPQKRFRLIVVGVKKEDLHKLKGGISSIFDMLESSRVKQLDDLGLPEQVSVQDAVSDLEITDKAMRACDDPYSPPGFQEAVYLVPVSHYQKLMHAGCRNNEMNSMRLARHRDDIKERFARILAECPRGLRMNTEYRDRYGLKKHRTYPLAPDVPSPTLTTLPDDVLHYLEPRILTVREYARIQSFPDWFEFKGKFTTGGDRRVRECPRYTQVGNAVPPLLARAIGSAIIMALDEMFRLPICENYEHHQLQQMIV